MISFFRLFERFLREDFFAAMSRFISLCSQRCTSSRLNRSLRWLESECKDGIVCGMMEVRLALGIARTWCIGCGCGDELDALVALSSLCKYDEKSGDQEKVKEMKGRALACTASFLRWGKEMTLLNPLNIFTVVMMAIFTCPSQIECSLGFTATQIMRMLLQAVEIGDSPASLVLGVCFFGGLCVSQGKKKAIELFQRAADTVNFILICQFCGIMCHL